jgi:hypothetical protein
LRFCAPGTSQTTTAKAQRANRELFETQESIFDFFVQRACLVIANITSLLADPALYVQSNSNSNSTLNTRMFVPEYGWSPGDDTPDFHRRHAGA